MSWQLGLAGIAALTGGDLQRAARLAGGGRQLWTAGEARLERLLGVEARTLGGILAFRKAFDHDAERAALAVRGIEHVALGDPDYPASLAELPDPPFGIFVTGRSVREVVPGNRPVVAVVGSRRATTFGLRFARQLGMELSERGGLVVSGLALGVDAEAHEGALAAGLATVAILGAGVDISYPRRNHELRERILATGAVISEYWPGTAPAPWRFPARNRIVAGVADAVVVVEAGEKSGALITADFALELGRPVLAVPGSPGALAHAGCNALLRAGAALCESSADVIAELPNRSWRPETCSPVRAPDGLDGEIYRLLLHEPLRADELVVRVGVDAARVAAALARLEVAGLAVRGHAQRFWAGVQGSLAS